MHTARSIYDAEPLHHQDNHSRGGTSYGAGGAAAPQISIQWGKTRPLPPTF